MQQLIESGAIVDIMLLVVVIEVSLLFVYWRATGRGVAPRALWPNVGAGACLMLALRGSLTGSAWVWIAVALIGALICHALDLTVRWRGASISS